MPIMVTLIRGGRTESRKMRSMGGELYEDLDCMTINVPFFAMLNGTQENVIRSINETGKSSQSLQFLKMEEPQLKMGVEDMVPTSKT